MIGELLISSLAQKVVGNGKLAYAMCITPWFDGSVAQARKGTG